MDLQVDHAATCNIYTRATSPTYLETKAKRMEIQEAPRTPSS